MGVLAAIHCRYDHPEPEGAAAIERETKVHINSYWVGVACLPLLSTFAPAIVAQEPTKPTEIVYGQILNLRAKWQTIDDPEVAYVALEFKLRVHNGSTKPLHLEGSGIVATGVQCRCMGPWQWTHLISITTAYDASRAYPTCTSIAPGAVHDLKRVKSAIVTMKKSLPNLEECEFRLQLESFCRRAESGQLGFEYLGTSPFQIKLKTPSSRSRR